MGLNGSHTFHKGGTRKVPTHVVWNRKGGGKQSLQDRGVYWGHPPGVGAAHQPRAEESIPYGELFGRVTVPGRSSRVVRSVFNRSVVGRGPSEGSSTRSRSPTPSGVPCADLGEVTSLSPGLPSQRLPWVTAPKPRPLPCQGCFPHPCDGH
jgi:hypothetical protein